MKKLSKLLLPLHIAFHSLWANGYAYALSDDYKSIICHTLDVLNLSYDCSESYEGSWFIKVKFEDMKEKSLNDC